VAVEGTLFKQYPRLSVHKTIISAVKRAGFVSDRMSYIILRGNWCDIVLDIHVQTEDKMDDVKDNFYSELGCVFNTLPMKILLENFNAKVDREGIFKLTNWG
jgi:hypothetical protein